MSNDKTAKKSKLPKKAICKWDRGSLEAALPLLVTQIQDAKYVCRKCGRAAAEKKLLCKSVAIEEIDAA